MDRSQQQARLVAPSEVGVVRLAGDVDLASADRVRQQISTALAAHDYRVVVDFRHVNYLDSNGIGALVASLKLARENGGELGLSGLSQRIQHVMDLTGLEKLFLIFPNERAAARGIMGRPG